MGHLSTILLSNACLATLQHLEDYFQEKDRQKHLFKVFIYEYLQKIIKKQTIRLAFLLRLLIF
jgi:hypothetical protein